MKKEVIKNIVIGVVLILSISALVVIMSLSIDDIRFSNTYTLRGTLYEIEDLGNNSYHLFINNTSHRCWSGGDWTFPYQKGKEKFYFTDVGGFSIQSFVDRDIDITYRSDGVESEIKSIGFTYYDSIRQSKKEKDKYLVFDEWMQENYVNIVVEYNEYLENVTR